MTKLITKILAVSLALLLAAEFVPGIEVQGFWYALAAAVVLGLVNLLVRPILVLLTFPITLLTLGLFIFVLNALLFWLVSSFVEGFSVSGFVPALLGAFVVSIVSALAQKMLR